MGLIGSKIIGYAKLWFASILIWAIPITIMAQNGLSYYGGVKGLALGHTGVTYRFAEGQFLNPATITYTSNLSAALSSERRFEDSGITQIGLSITKDLNSAGSVGLIVQQVGVESYNQTKIGITYARKLMDNLSVGAQFHTQQYRIDQYGSKSVFNASIGMMMDVNKEITIGLAVHNPFPMDLVGGEELPLTFILGADYRPSEKVTIFTEIEKDVDFPVIIKAGLEYLPVERVALRLGINSEPTSIHFGTGVHISKNIWIDIGLGYNQELGLTPGVGIALR